MKYILRPIDSDVGELLLRLHIAEHELKEFEKSSAKDAVWRYANNYFICLKKNKNSITIYGWWNKNE